jgi:hypothetical protein
MSDRPWLQGGDPALRAERALLNRLSGERPPAGSVERGWSALAAAIAAPPMGPPVSSIGASHAAKAAGSGIVAKIVVGAALTGTVVWTTSALLESKSTTSIAPPKEQVGTTITAPPIVDGVPEDPAGSTAQESPAKLARPAAPARSVRAATTLVEEGRLLAKAHQLIQSGQPQQALEVLRSSESRYPRSVLTPEREVLTIEALDAAGESSVARQRAERFLKHNPGSAYVARLQRFVE